jgi:hypothetical protein
MDQYQLIAAILWGGFQVSLIALIAGLLAQHRGRRNLALTLLLISVLGTLGFSFVGGFSVGRFTAIIPLLVIGYVVAMGRGPAAVASGVLAAALTYVAFSWLFTPHLLTGGPFAFVFGFWAIPFCAILAIAAFGWAFAKRPSPRSTFHE